ncbi:MAG: DUF1987 domain-containing protein [Leptospiraceae bacterium]|nr:DUF1987 domain-containing protein [Leptospiraceae bacterium]MCP5496763.1 DUF1987 domain-containing protein [Leptospiraceae bacterium]
MESLKKEASKSSPKIEFDANTSILKIEGKSYMENPAAFYEPIIYWVDEFVKISDKPVVFDINIDYLNTSSTKIFMNIFDILESYYQSGKKITINWHYDPENDFGKETGDEYQEDYELPFNVIEIKPI